MALKKCLECGNEISDKAESCPKCGCPLTIQPQLIEKTAKKYKAQELAALTLLVIFFIFMIHSLIDGKDDIPPIWAIVGASVGFVWFIVVRVIIWWEHE